MHGNDVRVTAGSRTAGSPAIQEQSRPQAVTPQRPAPMGLAQAMNDATELVAEAHALVSELESRLAPVLIDAGPTEASHDCSSVSGESPFVTHMLAHQHTLDLLLDRLKLLIGRVNL